jgi:hypothetical protein
MKSKGEGIGSAYSWNGGKEVWEKQMVRVHVEDQDIGGCILLKLILYLVGWYELS